MSEPNGLEGLSLEELDALAVLAFTGLPGVEFTDGKEADDNPVHGSNTEAEMR